MLICTRRPAFDVIVRLAQLLAPDADAVAVTHVGPGGQAANRGLGGRRSRGVVHRQARRR